jgi:hypothetical protein
MGGSGGGGYYGGGSGGGGTGGAGPGSGAGGGGQQGGDACDLQIPATIHSPDSDYASSLVLGLTLQVRLGGPNGRTIEVRTSEGYRVGSLIGLTRAAQLIECIQQGNEYGALVTNIESGVYGVLVSRATT